MPPPDCSCSARSSPTRACGAAQSRSSDPTRAHWRSAFIVGTLLLLGGNGGVVLAELYIPSGIAAVLIAAMPIWLALFDAILTRRRPSRLVIGGLIAGIVGVAILLAPLEELDAINPIGIGLCILAEISWAAGSVYARRAPLPRSALLGTGMEMLAGGLVHGPRRQPARRDRPHECRSRSRFARWLALAYLIIFGSIVAFTAYTWLLANVPVSTVGTYAYVNPIVAVALGAVILNEPITPRTLIASAIIIGAVVAMVSGRPRDAEEPGRRPTSRRSSRTERGTDPAPPQAHEPTGRAARRAASPLEGWLALLGHHR